jgi:pyrrolidone-carboxylate peptidase
VSGVVLVVGFGPFKDVSDNPASRLALSVDGREAGGLRFIGRVMPVSYDRGPAFTEGLFEELDPQLIFGVGVAVGRGEPALERVGRRALDPAHADVDGVHLADAEEGGPAEIDASAAVGPMAEALGLLVSDDAGRYVCNAWLYRVTRRLGARLPIAFLHIPSEGFSADRLVDGLARCLGDGGSAPTVECPPA